MEIYDNVQSSKEWMNSPKFKYWRKAWAESENQQRAEDDAWWDSLTGDDRAQAFRQIVKLIHKAEVEDKGSYRHALYEVFGLDYGEGLAYYMQLHNLISQGLAHQQFLLAEYDKQRCDETSA